jgi:predicted DCC family thiol-disulfide oxidoreductase YuxK
MPNTPLQVLYNGACPICAAGIRHQQGQLTACEVQWDNVHADPGITPALGLELEAVRERLHVRDAQGRLHIGVDAFIALWRVTPGQRWRAELLACTRWLAAPLYNVIARRLYRWNLRRGHWQP